MKWPTQAVQSTFASPLGLIHLCATPSGLAGLWFHDQRHLPPPEAFKEWPVENKHAVLQAAQQQLAAYFAGTRNHFDLPLDLSGGTAFQTQVWQCLLSVPAGTTQTYGEIAQGIGRPAAMRAVGAAVGRNPISLVVPCHRVLGADGSLTGYAGGLERKSALLHLERA